MKKYFVTGLVILLPLALTLVIVSFIFNLLTQPFVGGVQSILDYFDLLETNFLFLNSTEVQIFVSKIIILILLFYFTVMLGILARWFFFHYVLKLWDYILHRIPVVSSIYKTCQEVINTIFASKTKSFKQVVLAPYPKEDTYSIGLVTCDDVKGLKLSPDDKMIAVFVPTTPNPTSGFLMLYKEDDLIYLKMSVEEAFKYVISCGVIVSKFNTLTKEEAHRIASQMDQAQISEGSP